MFSLLFFFFFKQKTAYEMRISDWSSDVCSSDLLGIEIETHVELDAADGRKIVTFRIEKQAVEQRFRCLTRGRFAGAHDAINIGERMIAIFRDRKSTRLNSSH